MTKVLPVRITPAAERDLEDIHAYVETHGSPDIADALLDKLVARIRSLAQFPNRGSVIPELGPFKQHFRQVGLHPYRCVYTVIDDVVIVVAILDGRRDVPAFLEQRLLLRPD